MDEKIREFQKLLLEKDMPDSVSQCPIELRNSEFSKYFELLNCVNIAEIQNDNKLLPFIGDFVGVPMQVDIGKIEKLLTEYSPVEGDFFEKESVKIKREEESTASHHGFRPLKPKVETPNDDKEPAKKDCNVDEYILERISKEILETSVDVKWEDIVGLEDVKKVINEIIIWPMLRPDLFTGLRGPPKGLLLFGPPGTGKTMIGKCIASQCNSTFFSISASSLTSKWVGEGEKMVRALFYLARKMSPSVIFIDEIDSLLSQRSENENEGSRRIKTEFLVQFDGAGVDDKDRILIIGATNRPQEIDDAARRRLVKRLYVALPEHSARKTMVAQLIKGFKNDISEANLEKISELIEGYSGSDIFNLCREASMAPFREITDIYSFQPENARAINLDDFILAMQQIRKSVSKKDLDGYVQWNELFGSMRISNL